MVEPVSLAFSGKTEGIKHVLAVSDRRVALEINRLVTDL